jgi:arylsulfatase A-like enzyme
VSEAPDAPVQADGVQPSDRWGDAESGYGARWSRRRRRASGSASPCHPAARSASAWALQGDGRRDADAAGVRFAVRVDGAEAYARGDQPGRDAPRPPLGRRADRPRALVGRDRRRGARDRARRERLAARRPARLVARPRRPRDRHARQHATPDAPSVLLVVVDTLRADRLGPYGAAPSPSPTLDALAERGLVYEHAIAQASWTMPSVASLLTGLHPRSHGVVGASTARRRTTRRIPATSPTRCRRSPSAAAEAGITTVGVSGNPLISRATNFARGFETFVELGWDAKARNWLPAAEVNAPFLRWLDRNAGIRFLAYLHYMDPHDPYTPPEPLRPPAPHGVRDVVAAGDADRIARSGATLDAAEVAHLRRLYDAEIRGWDAELARVLAALAAHGLAESTVVVVTADHGEEFLEHGRLKHRVHLYDELLHVPLVIAGPGIRPGRVTMQAQGIDLFPTLVALLGASTPPGLPGQNLLAAPVETPAFSETLYGIDPDGTTSPIVSLRTAAWKLIHAPARRRWELYDLARDPGERENRFDAAPEAAALARRLADWETSAPPPPAREGHDPALDEKLRALGYVD